MTHVHHTRTGPEHCEIRMEPLRDAAGEVVRFLEVIRPLDSATAAVGGDGMVGVSRPFQRLVGQLERAAPADVPVLLLGETGTGKELAARTVHEQSGRARGPFVPVECSGLGESLFESELFGAERGAYTGADRTRDGLVAAAHGGTLFLDEIGDVPPGLQTRLLRLLESRTYRRVGGTEPQLADFRLVCATHHDLRSMVEQGRFRQDLYFRIRAFPIHLPPLRERPGDIELLASAFLARTGKRVGEAGLALLRAHPFPGNVRELKHVLEHAALLCDGDVVGPQHLVLDPVSLEPEVVAWDGTPRPERPEAIRPLAEVEADYLRRAEAIEPDRKRLAAALGISERTLYRKLAALRGQ